MIRKFILIVFVAALIMIVVAGYVSATVSEDMDIQAEIRNIWTSDTTSLIVLFGQNANLGQVLQADCLTLQFTTLIQQLMCLIDYPDNLK